MMLRRVLLCLLVLAGCGSRTGLGWLSLSDDSGPGGGGAPFPIGLGGTLSGATGGSGGGQSGKPSASGASPGGVTGGGVTGGGAATGGNSAAGHAGAGGGGAAPQLDDPTTLGDERPGVVECRGGYDAAHKEIVAYCRAPQVCCDSDLLCTSEAAKCTRAYLNTCDGDEDCSSAQQCCRVNAVGFQCRSDCGATAPLRHLPCGGPCTDTDEDAIPDSMDECLVSQFEDGKGPFPEDGCSDNDADGVIDGKDMCPTQTENGSPPKPKDGCP